ncbi:MAG: glutamine synthetase III [Oscillospiraceae bacterium]|nr:glutamine synthetase III [Oscillospiraceae bacterium]
MKDIPELFGSMVFNDRVMKARLPEDVYRALKSTIAEGRPLDIEIANAVAAAMRDWAIEKGATHYTHWFQPLNGITAEKHDSFIVPDGTDGVVMEFSGKNLVKGESDASSFPSGGLRATFEARGYTAWDPTSYAFIKDDTLCIPTAYCSYGGAALDKKTPLLRSMEAVEKQAMRVMRLFGDGCRRVQTSVGAEQEYFLIDRSVYDRRPDLISCGRTLVGARPNKGQELDDHYYGAINPRVSRFMKELDEELWRLGVPAKTEHKEVAPAQHELAPVYATTNIATDHNQLTMEFLKRIADRHGMVCLLHEKPFAGVNGSGKHNNWSIGTDAGENLLSPGETPSQNARFLLMLTAMIRAVDEHQDLLRISTVSAGNDHRLGGSEAPPTVISVFLGDQLTGIIDAVIDDRLYTEKQRESLEIGVSVLPKFKQDSTDRNRTSPFAFTGNKFEFRMPGSAVSLAGINTVLNTVFAESLCLYADRLEQAEDFRDELQRLIREELTAHRRIIFDGNNYSDEWRAEAARRKLLDLRSTVDALCYYDSEKNMALFERFGVMNRAEVRARKEIHLENYAKTVCIEAMTLLEMLRREIIPAAIRFEDRLAETGNRKNELAGRDIAGTERKLLLRVSDLVARLSDRTDELETVVDKRFWPYPSYSEILYSVK